MNADWTFAVGQVRVKVNGILVDLFEGLRLIGGLETLV
jgi:hypothetical protein